MSQWIKNTANNQWFDLQLLNLDSPYFASQKQGVFAIWYTAPGVARVIKVGQGDLAARLKEARLNPEVLRYSSLGQLKVSWIEENDPARRAGIEAYLTEKYLPLDGQRLPGIPPIVVPLIGE